MRHLRSSLRVLLSTLLLVALVGGAGCKNRDKGGQLGELVPPKGAPEWESRFAVAFDDSYTPTSINLQGRAPNDVLDQQLFQSRLGHAAVVLLVEVEQVWGRGRYQGRQDQFVELEVGEVLMGSLPKDAPERLMLEVESTDELPGTLRGEIMLLFLRWDADAEPAFHHHLMPADEELVALIEAMVKHAQAEGVLDAKGAEKSRRGKRRKRRNKRRKQRGEGSGPEEPVDDSAVTPGAAIGTPVEPDLDVGGPEEPPPGDAPEPDASTGLQDLGGGGDPEPDGEAEADAEPDADATPEAEAD